MPIQPIVAMVPVDASERYQTSYKPSVGATPHPCVFCHREAWLGSSCRSQLEREPSAIAACIPCLIDREIIKHGTFLIALNPRSKSEPVASSSPADSASLSLDPSEPSAS